MTIAIAAGWRHLHMSPEWWPALDSLRETYRITEIWHGACSLPKEPEKLAGADAGVEEWALDRGLVVQRFPAPWELYRAARLNAKAAGARRVADMLEGRRGYVMPHSKHDPDYDPSSPVVTTERVEGQPEVLLALPGYAGTRRTIAAAVERGLLLERVQLEPWVINRWHYRLRDKSFDLPPESLDIQRGTALGNPFIVGDSISTAIEVLGVPTVAAVLGRAPRDSDTIQGEHGLELYRRWLFREMVNGDRGVMSQLRAITPRTHLVCTCKRPDGTGLCHGDVVVRAWRWMVGRKQPDAPSTPVGEGGQGAGAPAAAPCSDA
jgi:hypothetical protein